MKSLGKDFRLKELVAKGTFKSIKLFGIISLAEANELTRRSIPEKIQPR
jgi:hypothetical protein